MVEPSSFDAPMFCFTDEHDALRASVGRLALARLDQGARWQAIESEAGFDRSLWSQLGSELGVLGMSVPESRGGGGGTLVDQAIVAEGLGARLCPGPLVGTMYLGVPLLAAVAPGGPGDALLAAACEGTSTVAVALEPESPREPAVRASPTADGWRLDGSLRAVVDAGAADVLVVAAETGSGTVLVLVDTAQEAVSRRELVTLDLTRRQAEVHLRGARGDLLAAPEDAPRVVRHSLDVAAVLLACEQVGASQHLLDLSVAHAQQRWQFGRPIGSFQAVKHRLADLLVAVEHARSAAYHAAWALAQDSGDASVEASIAQAICSEAFAKAATETVQIHGGIGFTWEHEAHLYLKRAVTDAALLGSAESHRDRVARAVLDGGPEASAAQPPPVATG